MRIRMIYIWEIGHPQYTKSVKLPDDSPDDKYVCIRDDIGETVMILKDRWHEFIKACQELALS